MKCNQYLAIINPYRKSWNGASEPPGTPELAAGRVARGGGRTGSALLGDDEALHTRLDAVAAVAGIEDADVEAVPAVAVPAAQPELQVIY